MRLRSYVQILTLVLCFHPKIAVTSPSLPTPPSALDTKSSSKNGAQKLNPQNETDTAEPRPYELESLSLPPMDGAAPEGLRGRLVASRVVRKHSRSLLGGVWSGALLESRTETAFGATLLFQNENRNESAQSYGLSVLSNRAYGVHWDFQKHCCLGDYYEPNWGFGIGSLWSTGDSLASLANIERYHLRTRVGVEDLFRLDRRLRGELILKVSPLGFSFQAGIGWTWDQNEFLF